MKVLAYDPREDEFFIGASFAEFSALPEKYMTEEAKANIETFEIFIEEEEKRQKKALEQKDPFYFNYFDYIKNLYGTDVFPDICFRIGRGASVLEVMDYDFPFHHMWNAYSPWVKIKVVDIDGLAVLSTLECQRRTGPNV